MTRNTYRPNIYGLRAVAVLLAIFHHLSPAGLTGGFVGVDGFFVISRFLITMQIAADMEAGRFSLQRFYQRRINRMGYTMDNCPPMLGYKEATNTGKCEERIAMTLDYITSRKFSKVTLAANWPHKKQAGEKLEETVRILLRTGAGVTPIFNNICISQASRCPIQKLMYRSNADCSGELADCVGYIQNIRAKDAEVKIVDPNSIICRGKTCDPVVGGVPLYRDNRHLNDLESRSIMNGSWNSA
jgi:hypothetical protein